MQRCSAAWRSMPAALAWVATQSAKTGSPLTVATVIRPAGSALVAMAGGAGHGGGGAGGLLVAARGERGGQREDRRAVPAHGHGQSFWTSASRAISRPTEMTASPMKRRMMAEM